MTGRPSATRIRERLDSMRGDGASAPERLRRGSPATPAPWRRMDGTILVVEDDHNIGNLVRTYLERDGYRVVWVRSGEEGLVELERHTLSLVVLDVGLPGIDGFEVCRRIRARAETPVIMLTARDEEVDRVLGLELGADDYVPKPFSPRELVARVKAVLRRTQPKPPADVLTLGDVELRRGAREASRAGAALDLTMKEFDLLACFMEHAGLALSREQLLEQVWGLEFPGGTRTVDQHVAQLRAKLGDALHHRDAARRRLQAGAAVSAVPDAAAQAGDAATAPRRLVATFGLAGIVAAIACAVPLVRRRPCSWVLARGVCSSATARSPISWSWGRCSSPWPDSPPRSSSPSSPRARGPARPARRDDSACTSVRAAPGCCGPPPASRSARPSVLVAVLGAGASAMGRGRSGPRRRGTRGAGRSRRRGGTRRARRLAGSPHLTAYPCLLRDRRRGAHPVASVSRCSASGPTTGAGTRRRRCTPVRPATRRPRARQRDRVRPASSATASRPNERARLAARDRGGVRRAGPLRGSAAGHALAASRDADPAVLGAPKPRAPGVRHRRPARAARLAPTPTSSPGASVPRRCATTSPSGPDGSVLLGRPTPVDRLFWIAVLGARPDRGGRSARRLAPLARRRASRAAAGGGERPARRRRSRRHGHARRARASCASSRPRSTT